MNEAWRTLKPGDRVRVVRGISDTEKTLIGREFVVDRWTKQPNESEGFLVVKDGYGGWWVHPEALEVIS